MLFLVLTHLIALAAAGGHKNKPPTGVGDPLIPHVATVCAYNHCTGTKTNPIPRDETWLSMGILSGSGCCFLWRGACEKCVTPYSCYTYGENEDDNWCRTESAKPGSTIVWTDLVPDRPSRFLGCGWCGCCQKTDPKTGLPANHLGAAPGTWGDIKALGGLIAKAPLGISGFAAMAQPDGPVDKGTGPSGPSGSAVSLAAPGSGKMPQGGAGKMNAPGASFMADTALAPTHHVCAADHGTKVGEPVCCGEEGTLAADWQACPEDEGTCSGFKQGGGWGSCYKKMECAADYGAKVGDSLCCGQPGTLAQDWQACPETHPICNGFVQGGAMGTCTSHKGNIWKPMWHDNPDAACAVWFEQEWGAGRDCSGCDDVWAKTHCAGFCKEKCTPPSGCAADAGTKTGGSLCCGQPGTLAHDWQTCPNSHPVCQGFTQGGAMGTCTKHCAGHFDSRVGGHVCCGQTGTIEGDWHICPASTPICRGFTQGGEIGTCITSDKATSDEKAELAAVRIEAYEVAPPGNCAADAGSKVGGPLCCGQPGTLAWDSQACPDSHPVCQGFVQGGTMGVCTKHCAGDYKSKVGDAVCCGQTGTIEGDWHICPASQPICKGFVQGGAMGTCVTEEQAQRMAAEAEFVVVGAESSAVDYAIYAFAALGFSVVMFGAYKHYSKKEADYSRV